MELIFNFFISFFKKLFFLGLLIALAFGAWSWFKAKREGKTFVVSFYNVDGLSKGAPVVVRGVRVGKVIQTYPLLNTNKVAVKAIITHKDFPRPGPETEAVIISDIEGGGGKIMELKNISHSSMGTVRIGAQSPSGQSPVLLKETTRLVFDFMQLSKDFAIDFWEMITSQKSKDYQAEIKSQIENSITSLEYGTIEADIQNEIASLNRKIKDLEMNDNKDFETKKALLNQIDALKNTIKRYETISDIYTK